MKNTIYEIAKSYTDKQEHIVDPMFRETPLFNSMPCIEASKGPINAFEKVKDVAIPEIVDYDSPLPVIHATTEMGFATIGKVGGRINLPLDKCKLLGKEAIINQQLPLIFNRAGQAFDYSYTYNCLKAFCVENSNDCLTKIATTGSGEAFYSMIGVTWSEGENCGLYQPALSGQKMFEIYPINGGNITYFRDKAGNDIAGYILEIVTYLGIQLARADRVHTLCNINAENLPSYEQLLDFVYKFGGYTANSAIYCHPLLFNLLAGKFALASGRADLITIGADGIMRIANCPVIVNPNMLPGTEAFIS